MNQLISPLFEERGGRADEFGRRVSWGEVKTKNEELVYQMEKVLMKIEEYLD